VTTETVVTSGTGQTRPSGRTATVVIFGRWPAFARWLKMPTQVRSHDTVGHMVGRCESKKQMAKRLWTLTVAERFSNSKGVNVFDLR